jgi:hypothetical protein
MIFRLFALMRIRIRNTASEHNLARLKKIIRVIGGPALNALCSIRFYPSPCLAEFLFQLCAFKMDTLKFFPLQSSLNPGFWSVLAKTKLEVIYESFKKFQC